MKKLAGLLLLFCLYTQAQSQAPGRMFAAYKATSVSAAAEKITIQQPTSGDRFVRFMGAYVYCSVACTVTLSRNGTAATSTTLTQVALNPSHPNVITSAVNVYSSSNVGAGTTISAYDLSAGSTLVLDLKDMVLTGNVATTNLSLGTNSITGNVKIGITWMEQ